MHTIYHSDTETLTVEMISSLFGAHALISDPVVSGGQRRTE
jgi:hypothetical protein